jgi:hypothetical protein
MISADHGPHGPDMTIAPNVLDMMMMMMMMIMMMIIIITTTITTTFFARSHHLLPHHIISSYHHIITEAAFLTLTTIIREHFSLFFPSIEMIAHPRPASHHHHICSRPPRGTASMKLQCILVFLVFFVFFVSGFAFPTSLMMPLHILYFA